MDVFANTDPEILEDFLTESNELLETLGQDLVVLEREPDNQELLNSIFRALHTIKGSSSFLGLVPLTEFAHAAEDALNALRKAEASVTADTMDLLLNAVDVIREQLDAVSQQRMPEPGPEDLAAALRRIGQGQPQRADKREPAGSSGPAGPTPLSLPDSKKELLPFMIEDLCESLGKLRAAVETIEPADKAPVLPEEIQEIAEELTRSVGFFEVDNLTAEVQALHRALTGVQDMDPDLLDQFLPRLLTLMEIIARRAAGLAELKQVDIHSDRLIQHLDLLLNNQSLDKTALLPAGAEIKQVFSTDGVFKAPAPPSSSQDSSPASSPRISEMPAQAGQSVRSAASTSSAGGKVASGERTIRVDVDRLEELLNLVGELVLQKNRILGLSRQFSERDKHLELAEALAVVGGDLDRITGDLQAGVMKTRMQPLSKLFNRYPRMIRDLARATNKQIDLQIVGGDTEVDKSVIEALGDPLVHILRNSVDHGLESPEQRIEAGKNPVGVIRVSARHEGNHVVVEIADDGRGLDRRRIGAKAVERGLISAESVETLSDNEIHKLIFAPGFSTAEKISDLSGRGVGMDVVRTNITKLNGMVDVQSQAGQGTTVIIRIPLTLAIMQAMVVGVCGSLFALPLSNILEIRCPDPAEISTVGGKNTLRLRDSVLPLFDLADLLGMDRQDHPPARIAVVVGLGEQRLGLMVHRLVGQQEVVIKPLDNIFESSDLMSGATVREDGGVSLILDVAAVFTRVNQQHRLAA